MPDLSNIPFGPGVELWNGLNKNLEVLFDPNRATYKITSSAGEWSVLFIRARKSVDETSYTNGWLFTLESDTVENVSKVYTRTDPAYDPPRIVNKLGTAIPVSSFEDLPLLSRYDNPDYIPPQHDYTINIPYPGSTGVESIVTIETKIYHYMHTVEEVGTYIMPIAYHKATDGGLDIRQVARSDWSFWPIPVHGIWCRNQEITDFKIQVPCGG